MTIEIINNIKVIKASENKTFQRIHDRYVMGNEIYLGIDYSTGTPIEDKPEYYIEIDKPLPIE